MPSRTCLLAVALFSGLLALFGPGPASHVEAQSRRRAAREESRRRTREEPRETPREEPRDVPREESREEPRPPTAPPEPPQQTTPPEPRPPLVPAVPRPAPAPAAAPTVPAAPLVVPTPQPVPAVQRSQPRAEPRPRAGHAPSQVEGASPAPARFSLGAGLGYYSTDMMSVGVASQGGVANYSNNIRSPTGIALFEVAASRRVRLMLGVSGSYTKRLRVRSDEEERSPRSSWLLGGGVGMRWIANPGGPVEIAPALLLGIHGGRTKDIPGTLQESNGVAYDTLGDDATLGADARVGVVTEYALLPNLHLRFEAYFLRAGFARTAVRRNGLTTRTAHMGLNWGIAPSLILRMSI